MFKVAIAFCFYFLLCAQSGYSYAQEALNTRCQLSSTDVALSILYFQPDNLSNTFWSATHSFAQAVAEDFNINLQTVMIDSSNQNRLAFEELVRNTVQKIEKPDLIMSVLYGGGEYAQLSQFETFGIPYFTVNTGLDDKILALTKHPRQKFKNWLGHMSPNEINSGKKLVSDLVDANLSDNSLGILGGSPLSIISGQRVSGAIQQARELKLNVIPPMNTDWTEASSIKAAKTLLHRVSSFDMLWTAGPDIAKGAIKVLLEAKLDVVVGSFDWSHSNAALVKQGLLEFSYGGHFMQPGWSLILSHDYLKGQDFTGELGGLMLTDLERLDKSNVDTIAPQIKAENWGKIDFTTFSKCTNPSLTKYNFRLTQ